MANLSENLWMEAEKRHVKRFSPTQGSSRQELIGIVAKFGLKPAQATSWVLGRPDLIVACFPVAALRYPGVFAVLRWYGGTVQCPECHRISVARTGTLSRRSIGGNPSQIQQFRCRECKVCFTEYTGTPLEDRTFTAEQWVLIHCWLSRRKEYRPSLRQLATQLGLKRSTVHNCTSIIR